MKRAASVAMRDRAQFKHEPRPRRQERIGTTRYSHVRFSAMRAGWANSALVTPGIKSIRRVSAGSSPDDLFLSSACTGCARASCESRRTTRQARCQSPSAMGNRRSDDQGGSHVVLTQLSIAALCGNMSGRKRARAVTRNVRDREHDWEARLERRAAGRTIDRKRANPPISMTEDLACRNQRRSDPASGLSSVSVEAAAGKTSQSRARS